MTRSKFTAYGRFALIMSGLLFAGVCFFLFILVSVFFLGGHIIPRGTLPVFGAIIFIIVYVLLLIAIYHSWRLYAFNIEIDSDKKTILFHSIFTRQKKLYNITDFDGYLETCTTLGGNYKAIYLLKEKKAEKIITGLYYKNIDELQKAISSVKYLGLKKEFSSIACKAFFKKPIIE